MSQYQAIKAATNAYIRSNGRREITGAILNAVMIATINSLGRFYQSVGVALPDTDPGDLDQNVAYLAGTPGTYTRLGGFTLAPGEVSVLKFDGEWKKEVIIVIPTKVSELINDLGFITNAVSDLVNYYTKTEIDASHYTKGEVDGILGDYYTETEVDTILQGFYTKPEVQTILENYYDRSEVDSIVSAMNQQSYVIAWDGTAEPVVGDIPAGVSVTWGGNPYVGTLAPSASTISKIYLVSNGAGYDEYITTDNSGYAWIPIGSTSLDLSGYATTDQLGQLRLGIIMDIVGNKIADETENVPNINAYATGIELKNGREYLIYVQSNGAVDNAHTGIWIKDGGTYTKIETLTAAQYYAGAYLEYIPSSDVILCVRPYAVTSVAVKVWDEAIPATLASLNGAEIINSIASEAFQFSNFVYADGLVSSATIKWSDGVVGTMSITYTNGLPTSVSYTHGTDTYVQTINYASDGSVASTSIAKQ